MNHMAARTNHGLLALAWLSGGVVSALLFVTAQLPPLRVTILLLATLTVVGIALLRVTELSFMSRLFVFLFVLPFSATLGYLFDNDYVWWQTPAAILLCQDHMLINEMLSMVIVGLCGLMAGIEVVALRVSRTCPVVPGHFETSLRNRPTLMLPVVGILLAVAFVLSWMSAPTQTIFVAAYASAEAGGGMAQEAGLNSSYLISYLILILICVDAEHDRPGSYQQSFKLIATMTVTAYIVVVLQLLRGDRECAGLLAALVMLYISSPLTAATRKRVRQGFLQMSRLLKVGLPLAACAVLFLALGTLRDSASRSSSDNRSVWQVIADGASENTWTAVALNNLGLAADYHYGNIEYLYGRTYFDYVLSLPPGPFAKAIGYERPLEADANPGMWYSWQSGSIACGGIHPVVVAFKNFGILGVFGVMFLCGAFICWCETNNSNGTLSGRLMFGCVATSSMLWFWYGDMTMIRTLMAWAILTVMHRCLSSSHGPPPRSVAPAPHRDPLTVVPMSLC